MTRPTDRYSLGIHHLAQPTMDPGATLRFYVDTLGAKVTHCIASKGWRPGHYDYIHMFLDLGKGSAPPVYPDNIAMFYYFGVKDPSQWPKYGTHTSFAARDIEELDAWERWLTSRGHEIVWRSQYEIMTSIYVWDPNGRFIEIAAQHRPLNEVDADDARLTAQALVMAANEKAENIYRMWWHKACLIEKREGSIRSPAMLFPKVAEFEPLVGALAGRGERIIDFGNFTLVEGDRDLQLTRPPGMPEAIWWASGTGGVKGEIVRFDDQQLVVVGE
jgi:catechol 2,3-dioxygenase-like lactoylglutathione lyase family enzyme